MKRLVLAGAASIVAAALSLFVGGGVAQAQEAPVAPQPLHVSTINILDSLDVEAPNNSGAPVNGVLSFLADSITLVGRDVLSQHPTKVADNLFGTVETVTALSDNTPTDESAEGTDLKALAIKAAPFAAIPVLGVIGGVAGALVGGVGGAAVAVFAGLAAAALVIAPAVIAGVGIALAPALAIAAVAVLVGLLPGLVFLVAGIVAVVSAIVVGLLVITWPLWFVGGLIMLLIGLGAIPIGTASGIATGGITAPIAIAGLVLMILAVLPGLALVVAGVLFGVAALVALISLPLVGLSVLLLTVAAFLFLGVVALVGSLSLLPAIVAFFVVGAIAAVVTVPVGGVVGFAAGGVLGAILGAIVALVWTFVIAPKTSKEDESEPAAAQDDFALAA